MNDDDDVTCVKLSLSQHATFKPGVFTNHLPGSHLKNMAASYFVSMFLENLPNDILQEHDR